MLPSGVESSVILSVREGNGPHVLYVYIRVVSDVILQEPLSYSEPMLIGNEQSHSL